MVEILGFIVAGGAGFFVDASVLYIGFCLGLGLIGGRVVSFLAAVTTTWLINRRYTFALASRPSFREWWAYLFANGVGALVNLASYFALVTLVRGCPPVFGVTVGSICGLVINYTFSRLALAKFHEKKLRTKI
jgi:putative flippase GtrA